VCGRMSWIFVPSPGSLTRRSRITD
jgi:hypothetical protein